MGGTEIVCWPNSIPVMFTVLMTGKNFCCPRLSDNRNWARARPFAPAAGNTK